MQNDPDVIQKAKRYLRRYRIWCVICAVCVGVGYTLIALAVSSFLAFFVGFLLILFGSPIVFKKCILSILTKKSDPDTFLATVYLGRFDTPAATWQLCAEYYCGHYQTVVSICQIKLNDPKTAKRHLYQYLVYLANVYFDIGDDENLRKVYEQYEAALSKEKPSKQRRLRQSLPRMTLYALYLKGDVDGCLAWVNAPTPSPLNQHHRTFCKAKLAAVQENTDEARRYYETLATEAPQLNYGKLAAYELAKTDTTTSEDFSPMFDISNEPKEVTLYPANRRTLRKILSICVVIALALVVIIPSARFFEAKKKYEEELHAYRESIRVLVEEDYNGVVILDTFTLKKGEDIIDTMFIGKTDNDVIVGCTYSYEDTTEMFYEEMAIIPIEDLSKDSSPLAEYSTHSKTTPNQISSRFCTVKADLPTKYYHLSTFQLNGQTVYYVVTEIIPRSAVTVSIQ